MKKKTITALMLLISFLMNAQEGIVASGGNATGKGTSSSYSIGQTNFKSNSRNNISSSEGIQQSYKVIEIKDKKKIIESNLVFSIYPNPVDDLINIMIDNYNNKIISYELVSNSGQLISLKDSKESFTKINMENLAQGIYFIKISSNKQSIKTFKIIKK